MSATPPGATRTVEVLVLRPVGADAASALTTETARSTDVLSAVSSSDEDARAIRLTPRQACVVMTEQDAALLVLAVAAGLRADASGVAPLRDEERQRVRKVVTLIHRTLARELRAVVRARAAPMCAAPSATHVDVAA
ncbi:MAG: hypothetical protein IT355_16030 [Gemmatimonadaceae bacterium]|nr:hypothetical protein [Gemmatimonadaceae bacterium]